MTLIVSVLFMYMLTVGVNFRVIQTGEVASRGDVEQPPKRMLALDELLGKTSAFQVPFRTGSRPRSAAATKVFPHHGVGPEIPAGRVSGQWRMAEAESLAAATQSPVAVTPESMAAALKRISEVAGEGAEWPDLAAAVAALNILSLTPSDALKYLTENEDQMKELGVPEEDLAAARKGIETAMESAELAKSVSTDPSPGGGLVAAVASDRPRRYGFLDVFAEAARQNKKIDDVIAEMPALQMPLAELRAFEQKQEDRIAAAEADNAGKPWREQNRRPLGFLSYLFSPLPLSEQPGPEGEPATRANQLAEEPFYSKWFSTVDDENLDDAWDNMLSDKTKTFVTKRDLAQAQREAGVDPKWAEPGELGDPFEPQPMPQRGVQQPARGNVKVQNVQVLNVPMKPSSESADGTQEVIGLAARVGRNRPGLLDYLERPELLDNPRYAKDGPEFEKAAKARAEFEKRNPEEARKERKMQESQAQAARAAAEYAESREYDWPNDPSGFKNNALIGRTMEKGEEVGEKVRVLGQGLLPRTDGGRSVYNTNYAKIAAREEKKPSLEVSGDFVAAEKFDGPRKGYEFNTGAKGKGYYRIGEERRAVQQPARKAVPAGAEPKMSRFEQKAKRLFGQELEGQPQTPEEENAAALRAAYEERVKNEVKVNKEEKEKLEQGTVVLSPDPRDVLSELGKGPLKSPPSDKQELPPDDA